MLHISELEGVQECFIKPPSANRLWEAGAITPALVSQRATANLASSIVVSTVILKGGGEIAPRSSSLVGSVFRDIRSPFPPRAEAGHQSSPPSIMRFCVTDHTPQAQTECVT